MPKKAKIATQLNVFNWARYGDFGKIVFLSYQEAEAALEKEAGNG